MSDIVSLVKYMHGVMSLVNVNNGLGLRQKQMRQRNKELSSIINVWIYILHDLDPKDLDFPTDEEDAFPSPWAY